MALESMFPDLAPLHWAEHPKSQQSLDLIRKAANENDERFIQLLRQHAESGICNESGSLLKRWDGLRFVDARYG